MILIVRSGEPASLITIRTEKLRFLRSLSRDPASSEIDGYRVVAEQLWKDQHYKCCYCERKITKGFNDVEHYRPKASADRAPGSAQTHGYWWLAFSWDNLLFACPTCNRTAKNDRFPLETGSVPIKAEEPAPGGEKPLLLDPGSTINPVEHITFVREAIGPGASGEYWWARPRNQSVLGNFTIEVCKLNDVELRGLRNDHFSTILEPYVRALRNSLAESKLKGIRREFERALELLRPQNPYVAFTYDVLRHYFPDAMLQTTIKRMWPTPSSVGL